MTAKIVTLNDNKQAEMPLELYNSCKTIVAMGELIDEQQLTNVNPYINVDRHTFDLLVAWFRHYTPVDYTSYEMELNYEQTLPKRELDFYETLTIRDVLNLHHVSKYLDFQSQHPLATYAHLKQPQLTISTKLYLMKRWAADLTPAAWAKEIEGLPSHWVIPHELVRPAWF